jgi:uncharacterized protein YdeI (YjbR/CyaY-like superfamily)
MQRIFKTRESWRKWLDAHHDRAREIWLVFYKKHTGKPCISYEDALEEALCMGWIDSLVKRLDEDRYARKFTPRTNPDKWSAANLKRVEKLESEGRMTEFGRSRIAPDVRPQKPVSSRTTEAPDYFLRALAKDRAARECFDELAPSHRRNYIAWISSAKREATRKKRVAEAIQRLREGKQLGLK